MSLTPETDGSFQDEFLELIECLHALGYTPPNRWLIDMDAVMTVVYCTPSGVQQTQQQTAQAVTGATFTTATAVTMPGVTPASPVPGTLSPSNSRVSASPMEPLQFPLTPGQTAAFIDMLAVDAVRGQQRGVGRAAWRPLVAGLPLILESRFNAGALPGMESGGWSEVPRWLERYYTAVRAGWTGYTPDVQADFDVVAGLVLAHGAAPLVHRWSWSWPTDRLLFTYGLLAKALQSDSSPPYLTRDQEACVAGLLSYSRALLDHLGSKYRTWHESMYGSDIPRRWGGGSAAAGGLGDEEDDEEVDDVAPGEGLDDSALKTRFPGLLQRVPQLSTVSRAARERYFESVVQSGPIVREDEKRAILLSRVPYTDMLKPYDTAELRGSCEDAWELYTQVVGYLTTTQGPVGAAVVQQVLGGLQDVWSLYELIGSPALGLKVVQCRELDALAASTNDAQCLALATALLSRQPELWGPDEGTLSSPVQLLTTLLMSPNMGELSDASLVETLQSLGRITAHAQRAAAQGSPGLPGAASPDGRLGTPGLGERPPRGNRTAARLQELLSSRVEVAGSGDAGSEDLLTRMGVHISSGLADRSPEEQAAILRALGAVG